MLRVATNTSWFSDVESGGAAVKALRISDRLQWLDPRRFDAIVLNVDLRQLLLTCVARKIWRRTDCRIVAVDLILKRPTTYRDKVKTAVVRWLVKEVDTFVLYYRDTSELQKIYDIPDSKMHFVPFKVNQLNKVLAKSVSDEGFFLACGRSNRDYGVLIRAFDGIASELRILVPPESSAVEHGTLFDRSDLPENVQVVTDDGSVDSWIDWMSRSRAVVLPIIPGKLSPSGVSAYLTAMALGKCLIMTDGPATRDLIDSGEAVLVKASDTEALRNAIVRVDSDKQFRNQTAANGKEYALSLQGEERLAADIRELVF